MALHFDLERNCYVGERLTVSAALFSKARDELIRSGMPPEDVAPVLLHEEGWSPEMEGVELLDAKQWAPTLWYDFESHRFVGPHLSVAVDVFRKRVRELAARGVENAYNELRQERHWSLGMAGVRPALRASEAVAAAERLLRGGSARS